MLTRRRWRVLDDVPITTDQMLPEQAVTPRKSWASLEKIVLGTPG